MTKPKPKPPVPIVIYPGQYPQPNRHRRPVLRTWVQQLIGNDFKSFACQTSSYLIAETGNGSRPWIVWKGDKPCVQTRGNDIPFHAYKSPELAASAVDLYEAQQRRVKDWFG